ncbi:MAG: hypothetical protein KC417_05365 [Myxococcales bacterium]|nr:hypothetical protein [Myxococcales bacterium]
MKRAKPTGAGLLASTRGEAMYSYVAVVAVVGLVGLGGFQAFGGAMSTDIDGGSDGKGVAVSAAAAGAEVSPITPPAPGDTLPGVAGAAATIASGASTSTADGFASTTDALDARESEKGESCGWSPSCHFQRAAESIGEIPVLGPVHNFITNFGLNPVAWVADPIGQLKGAWNRLYGVGQFAWNTVYGLGKLLHEGNTLFNPLYPGYWYDVYQNGWDGHQQRGEDFLAGAWEDAQGVGDFLARANTLTIAYECATGGPSHCRDYVGDLASEAWQNPVTQSLVEPFGKCAGEVGSAEAQNACGQIAADIALTVATTGWGKGARGAHVAEEAASYADELAEAGSIASKSDDLERAAGAATHADDTAAHADDLAHADDVRSGLLDDVAGSERLSEQAARYLDDAVDELGLSADQARALADDLVAADVERVRVLDELRSTRAVLKEIDRSGLRPSERASLDVAQSKLESAVKSLEHHATPEDLLGAVRDVGGRPVPGYNHLGEVTDAMTSVENAENALTAVRTAKDGAEVSVTSVLRSRGHATDLATRLAEDLENLRAFNNKIFLSPR